jgi:hypothetical protein
MPSTSPRAKAARVASLVFCSAIRSLVDPLLFLIRSLVSGVAGPAAPRQRGCRKSRREQDAQSPGLLSRHSILHEGDQVGSPNGPAAVLPMAKPNSQATDFTVAGAFPVSVAKTPTRTKQEPRTCTRVSRSPASQAPSASATTGLT